MGTDRHVVRATGSAGYMSDWPELNRPGRALPVGPLGSVLRLVRRHAMDTRPLANAPFRRLAIGQATSFIGSMLTETAVSVQIYRLTGSSFYVGLVGLAGLLPIIAFGLYGGAVADAVNRRTLYLATSTLTWLITIALFLQTVANLRSPWLILGLVSVQSGGFAVASSARGAIIPRIIDAELVPAANALNYTLGNIGQVAGPLLAGILISLSNGFAYAYAIDAIAFTAALYSALRLPSLPPTGKTQSLGVRSVIDGFRFIASSPVLWMSFLVDICAMTLAMPRALFPAIADARFHGTVGPLYAAIAIGSVVAGLSGGWISRIHRQGRALVLAILSWGGAVALAGIGRQLWLVFLLLAAAGAADLVSAVLRQTIMQTLAPDEMRGRMQGAYVTIVSGGPRLGDLRAGSIAAIASPTVAWIGGGISCLVAVALTSALIRPLWRHESSHRSADTKPLR